MPEALAATLENDGHSSNAEFMRNDLDHQIKLCLVDVLKVRVYFLRSLWKIAINDLFCYLVITHTHVRRHLHPNFFESMAILIFWVAIL